MFSTRLSGCGHPFSLSHFSLPRMVCDLGPLKAGLKNDPPLHENHSHPGYI
jgi:hypothetical protein